LIRKKETKPRAPGGGRKKLSPEQRQEKYEQALMSAINELVFPAICQAMRADPGPFKDRYLSVELSKTDIKKAYGSEGLKIWLDWFKQDKLGGKDRFGIGYKTRWSLPLGKYEVVLMLVKQLGHNIKDLPKPGFPPKAMQERLDLKSKKKHETKTNSNLIK
jgi:hypothetical protein